MTDKEYRKIIADARRSVIRKYGFRQSSYINFKVDGGYFFCLYFLTGEVRLTVKPMYADDLWWDIWGATENKKEPLSLRGIGAYSLSGQKLFSYEIKNTTEKSKLENQFEQLFNGATAEITKFIADNPDADLFYPDESKMNHDPDRLLYLMALIHNGKKDDALAIIKEARKNKHRCMFRSGLFSDSYTYISRWCRRDQTIIKIRNRLASIFNRIVQAWAYALMALGFDSDYPFPDMTSRLLDLAIIMVLHIITMIKWHNVTLWWILFIAYLIFVCYMYFGKRSERYYIAFGKLPGKTRLKWRIGMWIFLLALFICIFAFLINQ